MDMDSDIDGFLRISMRGIVMFSRTRDIMLPARFASLRPLWSLARQSLFFTLSMSIKFLTRLERKVRIGCHALPARRCLVRIRYLRCREALWVGGRCARWGGVQGCTPVRRGRNRKWNGLLTRPHGAAAQRVRNALKTTRGARTTGWDTAQERQMSYKPRLQLGQPQSTADWRGVSPKN